MDGCRDEEVDNLEKNSSLVLGSAKGYAGNKMFITRLHPFCTFPVLSRFIFPWVGKHMGEENTMDEGTA